MKKLFVFFCLFVQFNLSNAQNSNWKFTGNFNFGANVTLNYRKSQQFPGLRLFAAFNVSGVCKDRLLINYSPSVSFYTKSLGANLNPLISDIEIDLTNSFSIGYGWDTVKYTKYFKTINTGGFYNLSTNKKYAAFIGTNFIVNNHKRNQVIGNVSFSTPTVSINYYNDGAVPFDWLPVADNFDRWWTGGFGVYFHTKSNYNSVELSFDQFTGYSPLLYEISNIIGINIPSYTKPDSSVVARKRSVPPEFNTSAYNLRIFPSQGFGMDVGILGSLRTANGRVFGLQDIIHTLGRYPLHPNTDINRYYIGGTYNNLRNVRL